MVEYRIDELAREAGTTVRNVRAYQDRGLLPPPRRVGRVGVYTEAHLVRLRLIGELLRRGYGLGNIAELLSAWERGRDLGDVLGLELAVAGPWSDEAPVHLTADELAAMFDGADAGEAVELATAAGFLEPEGAGFRVTSMRELQAAAELFAAGVPLEAVVGLGRELRQQMDVVAASFVELVSTHVFDTVEKLTDAEVPRLAEVVQRLRPLAEVVVDVELARGMERHAQARLGERLAELSAGEDEAAS
jgi:DNA-binding transcriptional MerR regulator